MIHKKKEVKNEDEESDQVETGKLVVTNNGIFDFRIQGLRHSKVEQAEQGRVRQLVDIIESYPHKEDLQADLRQNNVYNPSSESSKVMIFEIGNAECFKISEADSRCVVLVGLV